MLRLAGRVLLAIASLSAGTWVGLGQPRAPEAQAWAERGRAELTATFARPPQVERGAPLPPDTLAPVIDPAQLPDPALVPHLNPDESTHRAWLLAEGPAQTADDGRRLVTFTFDDGPFPETTPSILEILGSHHVRGTFFWIGRYLDGDGDRAVTTRAVARQVAAAGHFIGNHTRDHEKLTTLTRKEALEQIDSCSSSIERVIGSRPTLFRPPYGALEPWARSALRARGLDLILWSVEAADMTHGDSAAMTENLRSQIEYAGGGIVLLHDIRPTTIPVLSALLDWLDAHRYDPKEPSKVGNEVVDLARYLQETGRSPQPFADRPALEHARAKDAQREQLKVRASRGVVRVSARGEEGEAVVEAL